MRELRDGRLSLLQLLSVVTLVSLGIGVVAVRAGNIAVHRARMRGSWSGLVGAFVAAVAVPDRRLPTFVVAEPLGAAAAAGAIALLTAGVIGVAHGVGRRSASPGAAPSVPTASVDAR